MAPGGRSLPPKQADVLIVGAGVAGLACAVELHRRGRRPLVIEASDAVGGRVRTDVVDGFLLDRGFQVFLTAYPEARRVLDYSRLDLRSFRPGAMVRRDGKFRLLADPFREPQHILQSLLSPIGTTADKLRIGRLRISLASKSPKSIATAEEIPTIDALRRRGFSAGMIEGFFRPFLGGIFLDHDLETSSRMFEFVFRMFSLGAAALPNRGMGQIPQQLAEKLPEDSILLNTKVVAAEPDRVVTAEGESIQAADVVVATELDEALRLRPDGRARAWRSTACLYFSADDPPIREPLLLLNGDGKGLANTVVALDQVAPGYAPTGASLISVSTIGDPSLSEEALWKAVQQEMQEWFGPSAARWARLRAYRIPRALPSQPAGSNALQSELSAGSPWVCGDHTLSSSLNGAMESGRICADRILSPQLAAAL